jgi:hypothetical protein
VLVLILEHIMSNTGLPKLVKFSVVGNKGLIEEYVVVVGSEASIEAKFINWMHRKVASISINFDTGYWQYANPEETL